MITSAGRHPRFLKTTLHAPSDASSLLDIPPPNNLELEFIHGCSKKGCNGNIFHMNNSGELVYPAAACGVVYNPEINAQKIFIKHTDDVTCIAKHPNGETFATGNLGKNNIICVWNSSNPYEPIQVLDSHIFFKNGGVYTLAFSNDGTKLAAVGGPELDNLLLVYDWQSGTLLGHCKAHNGEVFDLSFSPDDSKILLGGKNTAKFFEINEGLKAKQAIFSPRGTAQSSYTSCYDLEGNPICGMKDGSLYVFSSNKLVFKKQAHSGTVYCIYRTSNGFISSGRDGKVIWWQFTNEKVEGVNMFKDVASLNLMDQVRSVVPSTVEDDVVYASRTNGDLVRISNKSKVELLLVSHYGDQQTELWGLCTIPQTPYFCSCGDDGRLILWNYGTRKHVQQIKVTTKGDLRSVAYFGHYIATGTKYGTLFVYSFNGDSISSQPIVNSRDAKEEIAALQFSPDGKYLAAGSHDNNIYLYETSTFKVIKKLVGHTSFVKSIDFTTDGKLMRTLSGDYEVLLWDVSQGKQLTHDGHLEEFDWASVTCTVAWKVRGVWKSDMDGTDINATAVHFGRQLLVSAGDNGRVTTFHYPTATTTPQRVEYLGHCSHVTNVKFTENGDYLFSAGGGDVCIMQWKIQ